LREVFYHLYWNAFQPNSMMDNRSREAGKISYSRNKDAADRLDWDARITDRILYLKPDESISEGVVFKNEWGATSL